MTELVYRWHHDGRTTTFTWVGTDPDVTPARVYSIAFDRRGQILLTARRFFSMAGGCPAEASSRANRPSRRWRASWTRRPGR